MSQIRDVLGMWHPGSTVLKTHIAKTEIAKFASEPKSQGLRAEDALAESYLVQNFGDLITADHKVLSEGCEFRSNHRCAVVVQDLDAQKIQSCLCKIKTSQETERSLRSSSSEFGKACEDFFWNHYMSTPHRSETNGIALTAVRRIEEGTTAVLLQSGLDEKWWADSMECYCFLRNIQGLLSDGKHLTNGDSVNHVQDLFSFRIDD